MNETASPSASCDASITRRAGHAESAMPRGRFEAECHDRYGRLKWRDHIDNLITNVGRNLINDVVLGNTNTAGPVYMGLYNTNAGGIPATGDTQASHIGWLEVGLANLPTYTGNRPTPVFGASAVNAKATSAPATFAMTNTGNVVGCFINLGGSATKDTTNATLFSAGAFANGTKPVSNGDTINVNYTLSMT